jgi:D-beta-D-heptose 7-phosphate kinase/D-beta-D-heptose 1-phosphate adenosyltransferase
MKKHLQSGNKLKLIVASGYWDPIHDGHLNYLNAAKQLGDLLFVIVNNDKQAKLKKGFSLIPEDMRVNIIYNLKSVDFAIKAIDKDRSVIESLKSIHSVFKDIADVVFVNGGDVSVNNLLEKDICEKLSIEMRFGIGGEKIQSSSELIKNIRGKK